MQEVIFNAISYDEYFNIIDKIKIKDFEIIKDIQNDILSIEYTNKCLKFKVKTMNTFIALYAMNDFRFMSEKDGIEIADYISTLDYNKKKAIYFYISKYSENESYSTIDNPLRFILQCSDIDEIFCNIAKDFDDESLTIYNYSSIMIEK